MFKNFFKIAIRNIKRDKIYSFINIFGLSIGMSAFILIALMLQYMFSYDTFHKNYKRVYRVQQELQDKNKTEWTHTVYPIAQELKNTVPEIEDAGVIKEIWGEYLSSNDDIIIKDVNGFLADPEILKILTFKFIKGDPETALNSPGSIVISKTLAQKLFPGESALGKMIKGSFSRSLIVSGIIEDYPFISHIQPSYLVSFSTMDRILAGDNKGYKNDWENNAYSNYILLKKNTDPALVVSKIENLLDTKLEKNDKKLYLKPVRQIAYNTTKQSRYNSPVPYYTAIALFILILACINFINLTTARSGLREKEIGIRKVIGSNRFSLIKQFIGESVLISIPAILMAFILAESFLPLFNSFLPIPLELNIIDNWQFVVILTISFMLVGVFAGIYPAFYLSALQPLTVIKGNVVRAKSGKAGKGMSRRILVSFQFIISITLILSTVLMFKQVEFMKNKDLGYNKSNLLYTKIEANDSKSNFAELRNNLLNNPQIIDASVSVNTPEHGILTKDINWEGGPQDQKLHVLFNEVDYNFINTLQMNIVQGRNFSREFSTDSNACLINETLASEIGWKNPINKRLWNNKYTVIGVIKDFHPISVNNQIPPYLMVLHDGKLNSENNFCVRVTDYNMAQSILFVRNTLKTFFPDKIFDVQLYDADFDRRTMAVWEGVPKIFGFFSVLTIIIALIGLLGLVSFSTRRRTKEIGIRKVLGASESAVYFLVVKEFLIMLGIAIMFAAPVAYLVLITCPSAYIYQVKTLDFILPLISIITVTFLVTLNQVLNITKTNPSESLRYE
ncbi:MAG: ABC transporter permease [Calditrichaceae bacterium]